MLRYGSDCTGIDAPFVALTRVIPKENIHHVFASDIDAPVRKMIQDNFHPDLLAPSVSARDPSTGVDIYSAGFPCQSFAVVGKQKGFDSTEGTVIFDILTKFREGPIPPIILLENVQNLVKHDKGKTFKIIMEALHDTLPNHEIYHKVMSPHTHANWPQSRQRVFIVCLEKKYMKNEFTFPEETPLTRGVSDLVDMSQTGNFRENLTQLQQTNLLDYDACNDSLDVFNDFCVTDIGESRKFMRVTKDLCPALKRVRCKYYLTKLQRYMTLDEIYLMQGFLPQDHPFKVKQVTELRKMAGNSMCVPLVAKVWESIFESVDLGEITARDESSMDTQEPEGSTSDPCAQPSE